MPPAKPAGEIEVSLRINVLKPPPGIAFAIQRRRSELVDTTRSSGATITFDFTARMILSPDRRDADFRGPFVQGRPGARFVYVNSGTYAGEGASCWSRRAKVPLSGVSDPLARKVQASPNARLEASIQGTAKDGGPACASVPLLDPGWALGR